MDYYTKAVVNKGESYLYCQRKWQDLSLKETQLKAYPLLSTNSLDNFPIKSYLDPVTNQISDKDVSFDGYLSVSSWKEGSKGSFSVQIKENKPMTSEFKGIRSVMPADWDPAISWKIEDSSIAKLEADSSNPGNATLTGIKEGKTFLTVEAEGYGTRLISIIAQKPAILYFSIDKEVFTYTGKAMKPVVSDVNTDSNDIGKVLVEGVDYKVTYKNNVNAGKGKVIVTGIGEYRGEEYEEFIIKKAANPLKIQSRKAIKIPYAKLKKKTRKLAITKLVTFKKKLKDKKNYALSAVKKGKKNYKKYFKINKKTGKIAISKILKKGTYKIKIKVKALGNSNYTASGWKTVTCKIKIK